MIIVNILFVFLVITVISRIIIDMWKSSEQVERPPEVPGWVHDAAKVKELEAEVAVPLSELIEAAELAVEMEGWEVVETKKGDQFRINPDTQERVPFKESPGSLILPVVEHDYVGIDQHWAIAYWLVAFVIWIGEPVGVVFNWIANGPDLSSERAEERKDRREIRKALRLDSPGPPDAFRRQMQRMAANDAAQFHDEAKRLDEKIRREQYLQKEDLQYVRDIKRDRTLAPMLMPGEPFISSSEIREIVLPEGKWSSRDELEAGEKRYKEPDLSNWTPKELAQLDGWLRKRLRDSGDPSWLTRAVVPPHQVMLDAYLEHRKQARAEFTAIDEEKTLVTIRSLDGRIRRYEQGREGLV